MSALPDGPINPATGELVHPATGEIVPLDAPTGVLAGIVHEIRSLEAQLRRLKGHLSEELLARMDRETSWTLRQGGWKVTGDSPGRKSYNAAQLDHVLAGLVEEGEITQATREAAVRPVTELRVSVSEVNKLLKRGGEIARRVLECATPAGRSIKQIERTAIDATAEEER